MSDPRPRPDRRTTRRTALRGLGLVATTSGVLWTTGCDLASDDPAAAPTGPAGRRPSASPTPTADAAGFDAEADVALVASVLVAVDEAADLVQRGRRGAARRRALAPLAAMHAEHARVLDTGQGGSDASTSGGARPTWAAVRRGEERLQRRLVDWSLEADSGALARLQASMSAAVSQHLAALPRQDPGSGA